MDRHREYFPEFVPSNFRDSAGKVEDPNKSAKEPDPLAPSPWPSLEQRQQYPRQMTSGY